jgi:hypothetical protein
MNRQWPSYPESSTRAAVEGGLPGVAGGVPLMSGVLERGFSRKEFSCDRALDM